MTPSGIEPGTFRFVAQHLNHCATAVPPSPFILIAKYYSSDHIEDDGMDGTFGTYGGGRGMCTGICLGNLRERGNLQHLGVDGRNILE